MGKERIDRIYRIFRIGKTKNSRKSCQCFGFSMHGTRPNTAASALPDKINAIHNRRLLC
jgi:hypothetical protein